jgi:hypothetical protein
MSIARYKEILTAVLGAANEAGTAEPAVKSGNTKAAAAAPTGSTADGEAACIRCSEHMLAVALRSEGSQQRPKGLRGDCVACLEADMMPRAFYYFDAGDFARDGDYAAEAKRADQQAMVAETLSYALFDELDVGYPELGKVDLSKLPAGIAGTSRTCTSCMQNWVLQSSMAVAQDHDLAVHCHMCLHELDAEKAEIPVTVKQKQHMIWFAVASRYVGKFVACPLMRIMAHKDGVADKRDAAFAAHLKVLSGVDRGKTRRAADDARRTSSKADKQSLPVLEAVQYGFDDGAARLFSWVDSAWFQAWRPALVVFALVLMLFVDWWISAHESYLHGVARRLGLLGREAPATPAPETKGKKAAAAGQWWEAGQEAASWQS